MKHVYAVFLGTALAIVSIVAVSGHIGQNSSALAYGPPTPLCPPDSSECNGLKPR